MLGRMAYGYLIWQGVAQPRDEAESLPPRLEPLLTRGGDPAPITDKPASVLRAFALSHYCPLLPCCEQAECARRVACGVAERGGDAGVPGRAQETGQAAQRGESAHAGLTEPDELPMACKRSGVQIPIAPRPAQNE
jgi:hypothetical protein